MSTVCNPVECLRKQVKELNDGCIKAAQSYIVPWKVRSEHGSVAPNFKVCSSSNGLDKQKVASAPSNNLKRYCLSNFDINALSPNSW